MGQQSAKAWVIFLAGCAVTVFLLWFGLSMLLMNASPSDGMLVLLGLGSMLAALYAVSSPVPKHIEVAAGLFLVSIYFFARSVGIVDGAWLLRLLGLASLGGAVLVFYITFPKATKNGSANPAQPSSES